MRVNIAARVPFCEGVPDIVLSRGCSHTPTGAELSVNQWQVVAEMVDRKGHVPFVDIAYQGLAIVLRRMLARPTAGAPVAGSSGSGFLHQEILGSIVIGFASLRSSRARRNTRSVPESLFRRSRASTVRARRTMALQPSAAFLARRNSRWSGKTSLNRCGSDLAATAANLPRCLERGLGHNASIS